MSNDGPTEILAHAAKEAGRSWADDVRLGLRRDGRDVGMWPGTLSEARALATQVIGESSPTHQERELIARAVYAAARSCWNANRSAADDDDDPTDDG